MQLEWYGQSAFRLTDGTTTVVTPGTYESPIGEVVGVAAEHDAVAGTSNGAMTLFVFTLGGMRVAHLGDLGQTALREEQLAALGQVDLLLVPVGDGPTIGAEQAATIAGQLGARLVVPHHYRTERVDWLEPVDAMVERFARVHRTETPVVDLAALPAGDGPLLVLPAAP